MRGLSALTWKQKSLLGAALFTLLAILTVGAYATSRATLNQTATSEPTIEATAIDIDMKVENEIAEPTGQVVQEPNGSEGDNQAGEVNTMNSKIQVEVGGTPVQVPENGTVKKEITTNEGSAKIDISSGSPTPLPAKLVPAPQSK